MKYVVVTGARGGMGKAVVEALKKENYFVFALDVSPIEAESENVLHLQADITSEESVCAAFNAVKERTEEVFAVLHFAGIYTLDSLIEMDEKAIDRAFQINMLGCARVNRIFAPLLTKGSRIFITTSELAPLDPLPFTGVYAVTKAALDKYAYSLRMEVQLLGIDVVVLRPGAVDTGMLGASMTALDRFCQGTQVYPCNAERFKRVVERVEARKIPAEKVADKTIKILRKRKPKFVYKINRNPLLLLLNILPQRLQTWIIKQILK